MTDAPVAWMLDWTHTPRHSGRSGGGGSTIVFCQTELGERFKHLQSLHFVQSVTITPLLAGNATNEWVRPSREPGRND